MEEPAKRDPQTAWTVRSMLSRASGDGLAVIRVVARNPLLGEQRFSIKVPWAPGYEDVDAHANGLAVMAAVWDGLVAALAEAAVRVRDDAP